MKWLITHQIHIGETKKNLNSKIDTFNNTTEVQQGNNRVIKSDFGLKIQGYLVPEGINKELTKKPPKSFSKSTIKFNTEIVNTFSKSKVQTREGIRKILGAQSIQQIGGGTGYFQIGINNIVG